MDSSHGQVTTSEVQKLVENDNTVIVDVRPIDAYNGWAMQNEHRGGHIKSAKSLPAKWANYIDWIEVVRSKGISPENKIVLYGYNSDEVEKVAHTFSQAGFQSISVYPHFVNEWSSNSDLPMERLERFVHLVYPDWVNSLISDENPPTYTNQNYVICHAHYRNEADYHKGHIPGAIPLDTRQLESTETWNRRSPDELKSTLEQLGITHDTTVIMYGRFSFPDNNDPFPGSSAGHLGAIRCAAIMMYAGVEDVRILNGGVQSWLDARYQLTKEVTAPEPAAEFGAEIPAHPEIFVDLPEAKKLLKFDDGDLVSVRSWDEFIGKVSGYNYIEKTGRIPGAIFGNCGTDAYHMQNYRNLDHTMREYHEVSEMLKDAGITPDKHLAFYCGTGWRGSEAFYNAWLMGWPRVSIYDGGWFEWSNDPENPIDTGVPEETV